MRVVHGDASMLEWMQQFFDKRRNFDSAKGVLGVAGSENNLMAAICYHDYRWPNIEATLVAKTPRFATKSIIKQLLIWPFIELGVNRITAIAHEDNHRSQKLLPGVGFHLEGTLRNAASDGSNMLLYGLTLKDFEEKYG